MCENGVGGCPQYLGQRRTNDVLEFVAASCASELCIKVHGEVRSLARGEYAVAQLRAALWNDRCEWRDISRSTRRLRD